jgi:hypothetical protein
VPLLLLAVLLGVGLSGLLGVRTGMGSMSARGMCVVRSLLVMAGSVVLAASLWCFAASAWCSDALV